MAHDPATGNPMRIGGRTLQVELPIRGLRTAVATRDDHLGFKGLTDGDRITRIVIKDDTDAIIFDESSGVEGWSVEVFFEHPH